MIDIFLDKHIKQPLDSLELEENVTYYIKLKVHDPNVIEKEIGFGQCRQFIEWLPENRVGKVTFRDVAGGVNLFGLTYDVKSTKFLRDLSGSDQLKHLLKDISEYSSTLIFSPAQPASFQYNKDPQKITNNIFYIYKYLSSRLFHDGKDSLQFLLNFILSNPHFNQRTTPAYIPTFSAKRLNHSSFQRVAEKLLNSETIPPGHELCETPFIANLPTLDDGSKLLPKDIYSVTNFISYDTPENRFLKYFLLWCQEIFLNIYNCYTHIYQISESCEKSLKVIRKYLNNPFFLNIGTFSFLPTNSPVFANRVGYREIFLHYMKCRSQPKFFDGYLSDMFNAMSIKKISTLYEYWVFFRIAKEFFGSGATLAVLGSYPEDGSLKYGLKISSGQAALFYNKTYKHSPNESYNFNLRPDISLEITKGDQKKRFYFDAKYSQSAINDEPIIVYKNPNVIKMLSYLEAISESEFAAIVYPGTKFVFYSKIFKDGNNIENKPERVTNFKGVGALPLSPNHAESNEIFRAFMSELQKQF